MAVECEYFDQFGDIIDKYMPGCGDGNTMASQIVTAVNKLIYKWYNDGDVYDNTHHLRGWCNDLSGYANWLAAHCGLDYILDRIIDAMDDGEYEDILAELAETCLNEKYLAEYADIPKDGSIYGCNGEYSFVEQPEDDDEYYEY